MQDSPNIKVEYVSHVRDIREEPSLYALATAMSELIQYQYSDKFFTDHVFKEVKIAFRFFKNLFSKLF